MSFLSQLRKQKRKLKDTETVVTRADGVKYIEGSGSVLAHNLYGFVVDTKPDDIPIPIVDHLYIGSQDCAVTSVVAKYAIKHILSLGVNVDLANISQKYVPILDLPESDIKSALSECLPYIRNAVEIKENVLVHCNAGVSRTAMVTIAYLMHYESMSFNNAYNFVKQKRPVVQPNDGFKKQLQNMTLGKLI